MGGKALLLSVIVVHTYAIEHNFTESYETMDEEFYEELLEDYSGNDSDAPSVNYSIRKLPDSVRSLPLPPFNIPKPDFKAAEEVSAISAHRFQVSLNEKITPNQTANSPKTPQILNILEESAVFLQGPLVTRFMPSFYILIILISLPLNALALVTFTCRIREKKPAVIYMSHLVCVDLLFALLLPLKIHYQLNSSDWVFGEAACRVVTSAYYCYMYCSILLMMCMSVDRLLAVAFPLRSLTWRSTRKASLVCTLAWLLALAGTVSLLSMRQTIKIRNVGVTCHDVLDVHENDPTVLHYVYLFSILSCVYLFFPLIVTLVSYSIIIHVLRVKSERLTKSSSSSNNRRRAVIMAVALLIEFAVCFAPTNGILLYHCVRLAIGNTVEGDSSYSAYMLAVCLGSASVFLDPLLYYYGSSQCRLMIRSVFWCRKGEKRVKMLSNT